MIFLDTDKIYKEEQKKVKSSTLLARRSSAFHWTTLSESEGEAGSVEEKPKDQKVEEETEGDRSDKTDGG